MNTSGFLTSLITSLLIFLVLLVLFTWLSRKPSNAVVYYPSRILKGLDPPALSSSRSPFAWIKEAWRASEDEIIEQAGLDAAIYLIFLGSILSILVYTAIFCLPVLVPLSRTDDYLESAPKTKDSLAFTGFDKLAMGNISQKSPRLWAFVIGGYWLTFATLFVLWNTYRHVLRLRARDQSSSKAKPEQFAVLVRDIPAPSNCTFAEEVDTFFRKLHPQTYEQCLIVTNIEKASKIWTELESDKRKLAHAEAVFAESKIRPRHKTGTLGLIGPKVDSIDFYTEQIEKLTPKLEEEQKLSRSDKQQGAALVFFNTRSAAACAAQVMHGQYANAWTVMPAPEPQEVVWGNLAIPLVQRMVREFLVYVVVFLTIVFYMIPIAFISAIISLDNLEKKLTFLKPVIEQKEINTILQAFLPQLALIIFLAILPMLLMKLSTTEGIPSQSHLVRAAAGKYFYFNVFNVFLGVTIAGTLFSSLQGLIKSPTSIVSLLSKALPPQATFFISFVALKFFVGYGLELSRLVPLVIYHLKRKYLCKTEEELRDAWAPGPFGYATCVPGDMLIVTVTLCYAVIAPMILIFSIAYFALGWLIMRNKALKVAVPAFESGGRMWPHMHSRILAALFVSQITMLGYFGTKKFAYAPLIVPLLIATLVFAYICKKFYYPSFQSPPLSAACNDVKEIPSIQSIVEAYTPRCLLTEDKLADPEKVDDARPNTSLA